MKRHNTMSTPLTPGFLCPNYKTTDRVPFPYCLRVKKKEGVDPRNEGDVEDPRNTNNYYSTSTNYFYYYLRSLEQVK